MEPSPSWTRRTIETVKHEVLRNIGGKEIVLIIVLTGIFLFASIELHTRTVTTQIDRNGVPTTIITQYYGTPFEMLGFWWYLADWQTAVPGVLVIVWGGLLADAAIFSLPAFFIVFAVTKLRNDRERRLYYSSK